MFTKISRQLLNAYTQRRVRQRCDLQASSASYVNYRGLLASPPAKLTIGADTAFYGKIAADRPNAVVSVGSNTYIGNSLLVCAEKIEIGNDVLISWGCTITDHNSHSVMWPERANDVREYLSGQKSWEFVKIRPVKIEDKAWIGFNAVVLCGVSIGEGAVVGACSVVTKDVEPFTLVAGNPARVIRRIDRE